MNNHYETLNVSESSDADDIKRAYRKMAMDAHPDRGGDPERFKNINAAYETLSDPQRRQEYDYQRQHGNSNPFGGMHEAHQQHFNFNFGPGGVNIDEIFQQFHGGGPFGRRQAKNRDIQVGIAVDLASTLEEQVKVVNIQSPTKTETHRITIPRGVENGATIRFSNQGDHANPNLPRGDLFVIIQYETHPDFQLNHNYSLTTTFKISAFDAILGTVKRVRTVSGTGIDLTIPPGTAPGTVFKVRGHGLYVPNTNVRADLLAQVEIEIPRISNPTWIARLREIADAVK
jgi:DnaJ-class molecular chaperone